MSDRFNEIRDAIGSHSPGRTSDSDGDMSTGEMTTGVIGDICYQVTVMMEGREAVIADEWAYDKGNPQSKGNGREFDQDDASYREVWNGLLGGLSTSDGAQFDMTNVPTKDESQYFYHSVLEKFGRGTGSWWSTAVFGDAVHYRCDSWEVRENEWEFVLKTFPFKHDSGQAYNGLPDDYGDKIGATSGALQCAREQGKDAYFNDAGLKGGWINAPEWDFRNMFYDKNWLLVSSGPHKPSKTLRPGDKGGDGKHDEKHVAMFTGLGIDTVKREQWNTLLRWVMHPLYINGWEGQWTAQCLRVAFAKYVWAKIDWFDDNVPGEEWFGHDRKEILPSTYDKLSHAEAALWYLLSADTWRETGIHYYCSYEHFNKYKEGSDWGSHSNGLDNTDNIRYLGIFDKATSTEKIRQKCRDAYVYCREQSWVPTIPLKAAAIVAQTDWIPQEDRDAETITLTTFAKWITGGSIGANAGSETLEAYGRSDLHVIQEKNNPWHKIGIPEQYESWWENGSAWRTVYTTWGAMKDPDNDEYHLWGSHHDKYKKFKRPFSDANSFSTVEDVNHELGPNDPLTRDLWYLDRQWGDRYSSSRGRTHIFRAFGLFRNPEVGKEFSRDYNDIAKAGSIPAKHIEAIKAMGIPLFNKDGTYPAAMIKELNEGKQASYPRVEDSIWDKVKKNTFGDIHKNFQRVSEPTAGAASGKGPVGKDAFSADTYGPRYIRFSKSAFTGDGELAGVTNTILDWDPIDNPNWRKSEYKAMTDGEENEKAKGLLDTVSKYQDDIPEFKGIYMHFFIIKQIVNEYHQSLIDRINKGNWGGPGSNPNANSGAIDDFWGMVSQYAIHCSYACASWYQWIKANNSVVYLWYALKLKLMTEPDIDAETLKSMAQEEAEAIEAASLTELEKQQLAEQKKEEERKKKLQANLAAATGRDGKADDAKRSQRDREKFASQCMLMGNIDSLKKKYRETIKAEIKDVNNNLVHSEAAYSDRFLLLTDTKQEFSKIPTYLSCPKKEEVQLFTQITPDIVSALTPKIRLFKVYSDRHNSYDLTEVEFPFENFTTLGEDGLPYMASELDKGHGVGIKSFSWSFDGTTPATAKKNIKAELVLYFQNFNDLIKKRSFGSKYPQFRYIELLLLPYSKPDPRNLDGDEEKARKARQRYSDEELKQLQEKAEIMAFAAVHDTPSPVDPNSKYVPPPAWDAEEIAKRHAKKMAKYDKRMAKKRKKKQANANAEPRHPNDYKPENYRIRADVGWNNRTDAAFRQILEKRCAKDPLFKNVSDPVTAFNNALNMVNKSFYLNMIDHDLDIKNDGTVEIKVTYAAYIESAMKSTALDALATPESVYIRRQNQKELDDIISSGNCDAARINDFKALHAGKQQQFIKAQYQSIKRRLIQRRKVYYCNVSQDKMSRFVKRGIMPKLKDKDIMITVPKNFKFKKNSLKSDDIRKEKKKFQFFFLGDLLHTILDCMYEPKRPPDKDYDPYKGTINVGKIRPEVQNTKLLLSSFVYDDYFNVKKKGQIFNDVNLSEVPISMEYFQKWMTEQVIEPERQKYPVMDFVRDLIQMVIDVFLETCINKSVDKSVYFDTGQILALSDNGQDMLLDMRDKTSSDPGESPGYMINVDRRHSDGSLPLRTSSINAKIGDFWNYIFLYPITSMNTSFHRGEGDRRADEDQGIYHYQIGANRGLLKNIKFSKVDMQYIREARFFNHGHDGLMQLAAVYKASLNMIGNTLYYPGMELFIDPRGLGGPTFDPTQGQKLTKTGKILEPASVANALGIGGYHIVTKVKSTITPEKFDTVVDAQFHYSGDKQQSLLASSGKPVKNFPVNITEPPPAGLKKCKTALAAAQKSYAEANGAKFKKSTKAKKKKKDPTSGGN